MPPTIPLVTGGAPLVYTDDGKSPYARAEALLWWTKDSSQPHIGGRALVGAWWNEDLAFEVGGWLLEQRSQSAPLDFTPLDTASLTTRLFAVEGNARYAVARNGALRLDALGGMRFLALDESLRLESGSDVLMTYNRYYLVQLGAEAEYRAEALSLRGYTKLGLGVADQSIKGLGEAFPLASQQQSRFAFAPEVGITFGYEVAPGLNVTAGYSVLFLNSALRPSGADDFHTRGLNFGLHWRY